MEKKVVPRVDIEEEENGKQKLRDVGDNFSKLNNCGKNGKKKKENGEREAKKKKKGGLIYFQTI